MSDIHETKKSEVKLPENVQIDYTFERTLKSFLKEIDKSNILKEIKARKYYMKKSELKRKLENERRRKNKTSKNMKRRKNK